MTFNRNRAAIDVLDKRLRTAASRLLPLAEGYGQHDPQTLKLLFANDAERSAQFSLTVDELHLDYSKSLQATFVVKSEFKACCIVLKK